MSALASFSNQQMLAAALIQCYAGVQLISDPAGFLEKLRPILAFLEEKTGLQPYRGGAGSGQVLVMMGVLLCYLGYYFLMSVYTLDEKFKRNSTPGRCIIAFSGYYLCTKTPHSNSLIALFSIFNLVTGIAMGMTVGFGDGNAVDIEIAEAKAEEDKRRLTKEAASQAAA